jgi:acyl-coenzyme A synthetase/AMP-(fatty) acid ligase
MNADYCRDTQKALDDLLCGPRFPDKEYSHGVTFAEVYSMAAELRLALADARQGGQSICLAVEDKAVMAAALLAAIGGGPTLLLPYACSAKVLHGLQQSTGFSSALADPNVVPEGVRPITLPSAGSKRGLSCPAVSLQSELLKIFTGGSTGTPQLWSKTVENIFSEGLFLARRYQITEHDCLLATVPPYHIYGLLFSVIVPLLTSATVVGTIPSFPTEIASAVADHQVTVFISVPPHYRVLHQQKMNLRLAFSSAGMLDQEDNERFCRCNGVGVVEVYGSTETGGIASRDRSRGEEYFTPFSTVDYRIKQNRLAVRSPYLSPDLAVDKEGFYLTADRVEEGGHGQFSLRGRADKVTKVGGKRVDLEQISLLLKKEPGIVDCVVTALPENGGRGHRIGALIQGKTADIALMQKNLAEALEPYALPRRIKKVEQIPMTRNGKYDWNAIVSLLEA